MYALLLLMISSANAVIKTSGFEANTSDAPPVEMVEAVDSINIAQILAELPTESQIMLLGTGVFFVIISILATNEGVALMKLVHGAVINAQQEPVTNNVLLMIAMKLSQFAAMSFLSMSTGIIMILTLVLALHAG